MFTAEQGMGTMQGRKGLILGIDAGTTSVKTVAFDLDGRIVSLARSSIHLRRATDDATEVGLEQVWDATVATVVAVVEELGTVTAAREVVAIGLTGQGDGAWFVDASGTPVRPAALWLDGRARSRVRVWEADGRAAAVAEATGSPLFPGALPVLVDELPELAAGGPDLRQLNCKDWLRYRMTGTMATDPSEASRGYLDTRTGAYSDELLEILHQERVRDWLPPVRMPAERAGTTTPEAAAALGLPAGIPVAVGMVDTAAAGVGLGAIGDGDSYAILGTTGFVGVNHSNRSQTRSSQSIVLSTGRGTQVLESLAPMTGTPNLDWARASIGHGHEDWPEVEKEASAVPPGSGGVVYLPYGSLSGERAPFADDAASAAWLGMSVVTSPGELLRSVYEGLAFSLAECCHALGLAGDLAVCGGGAESDLFCAVLASVLNRRVVRQDAPEVGARGAATLAAVAGGVQPDLRAAVAALAPAHSTFEPRPDHVEIYRETYRTFLDLRDAVRPRWSDLRSLRERSHRAPAGAGASECDP